MYQHMHVGMRVLPDRRAVGNTNISVARLELTAPDRSAAELRVIIAAEIDDVALFRINRNRQIVIALRVTVCVEWQDIRRRRHQLPRLPHAVQPKEAAE